MIGRMAAARPRLVAALRRYGRLCESSERDFCRLCEPSCEPSEFEFVLVCIFASVCRTRTGVCWNAGLEAGLLLHYYILYYWIPFEYLGPRSQVPRCFLLKHLWNAEVLRFLFIETPQEFRGTSTLLKTFSKPFQNLFV